MIRIFSCSSCEEMKGYSYSRLVSVLQTMDITLHVLRQSGFHLKTNRTPKSQIFGKARNLHLYFGLFEYLTILIGFEYGAVSWNALNIHGQGICASVFVHSNVSEWVDKKFYMQYMPKSSFHHLHFILTY